MERKVREIEREKKREGGGKGRGRGREGEREKQNLNLRNAEGSPTENSQLTQFADSRVAAPPRQRLR